MSACPRVIIFTGAPSVSSLCWSEGDLTAPLQRAFGEYGHLPSSNQTWASEASKKTVVWRKLSLILKHLSTGLTPKAVPEGSSTIGHSDTKYKTSTSFLNIQSLSSKNASAGDELTQFLEVSFALHEDDHDIKHSVLADEGSQQASLATTTSFTTLASSASTSVPEVSPQKVTRTFGHIIALENIPKAADVRLAHPQKIMRSFVVAILAMPSPRRCKNKWGRHSRPSERLELTVADETKSGFGVNLWLPSSLESSQEGEHGSQSTSFKPRELSSSLSRVAGALRLRDIVLLRDVALSEFKGKVYANSREGHTRIELFFRHDRHTYGESHREPLKSRYSGKHLDRYNHGGKVDSVLSKTVKVHQWLINFIGHSMERNDTSLGKKRRITEIGSEREEWSKKRRKMKENDLPLDTP